MFDVAIVGGGPAGATCAAFCAAAGLKTLVLEREKFPREKVCGDCLNPSCWPVLRRLQLGERVRTLPHRVIETVEFIGTNQRALSLSLPAKDDPEISIKRSLFDQLLLVRARELGAEVQEERTVSALRRNGAWRIKAGDEVFSARLLIAADGRNSTVARLLKIFPRATRERVALQAHVPLPPDFGARIVLQFLPEGYSGQAPVTDRELNLCLVGTPPTIGRLRAWAARQFDLPNDQLWRTITPLTRPTMASPRGDLFFIGDVARVVEPFTGEGIFYALRSGELAAQAIIAERPRDYATAWARDVSRAIVDQSPGTGRGFVAAGGFGPVADRAVSAGGSASVNGEDHSRVEWASCPPVWRLAWAELFCCSHRRKGCVGQMRKTGAREAALAESQAACFHGVRHQHGNGHRSDTARYGGDGGTFRSDFIEGNIAHQLVAARTARILDPVDPDIDNDRAVADMFLPDESGAPDGRDQNISRAGDLWKIPAARMHDRHGGVAALAFLHEQKGERFSDNHAASENNDMRAGDLDAVLDEQTLATEGRAGNETGRIAHGQLRHVERMKTIHILRRIERAHDGRLIDLRRWRRLHENAMNGRDRD